MPDGAEIQRSIVGAWRLMNGKAEGLRLLDLSIDGFWNSFFAIVVALPGLVIGWMSMTADAPFFLDGGSRLALMLRLAVVDVGAWVLPVALLAAVARPAGIADRLVPYVVATNWGSVIVIWLMVPAAMLRILFPAAADLTSILSLVVFVANLALTWRMTNAAIGRGPSVATAVFIGMFFGSLLVLFALQSLVGLDGDPYSTPTR
jgi:hypothetical protein